MSVPSSRIPDASVGFQVDDSRGVQEPLNETMCGCNDIGALPGQMGAHGHEGVRLQRAAWTLCYESYPGHGILSRAMRPL